MMEPHTSDGFSFDARSIQYILIHSYPLVGYSTKRLRPLSALLIFGNMRETAPAEDITWILCPHGAQFCYAKTCGIGGCVGSKISE